MTLRRTILLVCLFTCGAVGAQTPRIDVRISKGPDDEIRLDWQDECPLSGTDYAVFEGLLGDFDSHTDVLCTTSGTLSGSVTPDAGDRYFLIAPLENGTEGSYGQDSDGNERAVGVTTCLPQQVTTTCLTDSFVDADAARVARLDQVMDQAAAIIEGGGRYADVATMLAGEPDVTGVSANGISMYFTVGGLPTTIYDAVAARHGGPLNDVIAPGVAPGAGAATRQAAFGPMSAGVAAPIVPRGQRMVGEDDDGDGFRDLPKHALILSPWAFDFVPNDSAPDARTILEGIRDYQEGSITYKENTTDLLTNTMTIADYTVGWDEKDVIFISSHGDADPNAAWGPDPYLWMGIGGSTCADIAAKLRAEVPDPAERQGLHCSFLTTIGAGSNPITGRDTLGTRAFWEHHHGGDLNKKLIWFDACRSAFLPGLAQALVGTDSIFLGWSEYVNTTTSTAALDAVLRETAELGFPVLRSFVRECSGTSTCVDPPTSNPPATLLAAWDRADLRVREGLVIPTVPLRSDCGVSPTQPVELTCPSCGGAAPMSFIYNATVEGVTAEEMVLLEDPFQFGAYQLRLFADIDDVESGYAQPVWDGYFGMTSEGTWSDLFGITLFGNDICPYDVIEYNPWVLLPAFDEAMPGNDARDRMYSWEGPFTLEIDPILFP
jgi:hypothetical protein